MQKRIVGQEAALDEILMALAAGGHALLVGVPGLAKTLMIRSIAEALALDFRRIQFTPDLVPSDITGSEILEEDQATGARSFRFVRGPIFANIVLADEINRAPPRTQAALLEAMQEHRVTAAGESLRLPEPFFVLATQNPIEQEGTYPLPEAQLDRFMFHIDVEYPEADDEVEIVKNTTSAYKPIINKILSPEQILALQDLVLRVPVSDHVVRYAVNLVRRSRPSDATAPDFVKEFVSWGAGPRASQYLILGGKARAILDGRYVVSIDDVKALAKPILQHRILPNFHAEAQGVRATELIERLLKLP